jgi:hypothetical protein
MFSVAFCPFEPFSQFLNEFFIADAGMLRFDAVRADANASVCHVDGYGYFFLRVQPSQAFSGLVRVSRLPIKVIDEGRLRNMSLYKLLAEWFWMVDEGVENPKNDIPICAQN